MSDTDQLQSNGHGRKKGNGEGMQEVAGSQSGANIDGRPGFPETKQDKNKRKRRQKRSRQGTKQSGKRQLHVSFRSMATSATTETNKGQRTSNVVRNAFEV